MRKLFSSITPHLEDQSPYCPSRLRVLSYKIGAADNFDPDVVGSLVIVIELAPLIHLLMININHILVINSHMVSTIILHMSITLEFSYNILAVQ